MKLGKVTTTPLDQRMEEPKPISYQELIALLADQSDSDIKMENIMARVTIANLHMALLQQQAENTRLWTALSLALAVILALLLWNGVG